MSSFALKLIACVAMFIDHIFCLFVPFGEPAYWVGRGIGRIAFPIFCFLLVEGYYHTASRKKYLARLLLFALLSEIPFDFAFNGFPQTENLMRSQNVMITLLIGFLLIYIYDYLNITYRNQPLLFNMAAVIAILAATGLSIFLASDYSYVGVLFILAFYLFRGKKHWIAAGLAVIIMLFSNRMEFLALLALIPIFLYNGKEGKKIKYFFYVIYPAHLFVLGLFHYF